MVGEDVPLNEIVLNNAPLLLWVVFEGEILVLKDHIDGYLILGYGRLASIQKCLFSPEDGSHSSFRIQMMRKSFLKGSRNERNKDSFSSAECLYLIHV